MNHKQNLLSNLKIIQLGVRYCVQGHVMQVKLCRRMFLLISKILMDSTIYLYGSDAIVFEYFLYFLLLQHS